MNRYKRLFAAGLIAPTVLGNIAPSMSTVYAAGQEDIVLNHDDDLQYGLNEDLKTFKASFYYSYDDGTHIIETTEPIVIDVTEGDSITPPEVPELKNHEFIGWDRDMPDAITENMSFHARYQYIEDDASVNDSADDILDNEVSYDILDNEASQDNENLDTEKVLTEGVYMTQDEYEDYKKELNSFDITQMDGAYLEQLESDEANSLAMTLENSLIVSALPDDSSQISNIEDSEFVMDSGTFYPFRSFIGPYLQTHSGETSVDDNVGSVWMKVFKEETTWTGSGKWSDKYHVNDTDKGVQITYNIGYDDALARAIAPLNSKLLDNMAASQPGVLMQYMRDYKQHPQVMKAIVAHINAVQADKNSHGDDSVYLPVLYDKKHSVNERVYFLNALIHYYGSLNSKAQEKFSYMENELAVAYRQKDSRFQISRSETPEIYDLIARTEMSARPVYYKYDIDAMMTFHTDGKAKTMSNFLLQKTGDFDATQTTNFHKEFFNYVVSTNKGVGRWMGYFDSTVYKKYDYQSTPANHIFDKTSSVTGTQWLNLDSARDVFGGDGVFGGDAYDEAVTDPLKTDLYLISMSQGLKDLVNQNSTTKALYDAWYRKAADNNTVTISYNLNGGTNSTANPNIVNIFSDVTFASASRIGHTFGGWYTDSGLTKKIGHFYSGWTHRNDGVKTVPLYAKFTPNSYRLTINANGGTCSTGSIAAVVYNNTVNVANPTRTGYKFTGWTVSGAGSSISGTTFKMGHANATLTANWKADIRTGSTNWALDKGSRNVVNNGNCSVDSVTYRYDPKTKSMELHLNGVAVTGLPGPGRLGYRIFSSIGMSYDHSDAGWGSIGQFPTNVSLHSLSSELKRSLESTVDSRYNKTDGSFTRIFSGYNGASTKNRYKNELKALIGGSVLKYYYVTGNTAQSMKHVYASYNLDTDVETILSSFTTTALSPVYDFTGVRNGYPRTKTNDYTIGSKMNYSYRIDNVPSDLKYITVLVDVSDSSRSKSEIYYFYITVDVSSAIQDS